jgi:hypothetical protein
MSGRIRTTRPTGPETFRGPVVEAVVGAPRGRWVTARWEVGIRLLGGLDA